MTTINTSFALSQNVFFIELVPNNTVTSTVYTILSGTITNITITVNNGVTVLYNIENYNFNTVKRNIDEALVCGTLTDALELLRIKIEESEGM